MDGRETEQPRRRLTQAEAKQRTRDQLLGAAVRIFAEKGFGAASLEEISELAGYSTGAMYYNFKNKHELFRELLRAGGAIRTAQRAETVAEIFDPEVTPDPFARMTEHLITDARDQPYNGPLEAEFMLYAMRNPEGMEVLAAQMADERGALAPILAEAMKRYGSSDEFSPTELTTVLLVLFGSLVRLRGIDENAFPPDLFARVMRALLTGNSVDGDSLSS